MLLLPTFVPGMALAVATGLLIGFERGWQQRGEAAGQRVAGVRTFALLALLGGLAGLAASEPVGWIAVVAVGGAVAALLVAHALDMWRDRTVSATGAVAALATLLLGAFASTGHHALAAAAAAAIVVLLAAREPLHALLRSTSEDEVKAFVRLALVIFLIFPLLPDVGLGPYASLNPRRLWFVVVVIAAIAFGSYALSRWWGDRHGGLVAAGLGALVSSTAVTIACAQAIRRGGGGANQAGIALASAVMLGRVPILVALLAPRILLSVVVLIGPALLLAVLAAAALLWVYGGEDGAPARTVARPPGLGVALMFAALVAAVSVAAAWLENDVGQAGAATAIAVGGMVDIDSAIAALGGLPGNALSPRLTALAIAVPVALNSLLKCGLTVSIGGWGRARWAGLALLLPVIAIAGGAAVLLA